MKTRIRSTLHIWLALLLTVVAMPSWAQTFGHSVSGEVRDASTGKRLPQASVTTPDGHEMTVTNADGEFTLKTLRKPSAIYVSCLGYNATKVSLQGDESKILKIKLKPGTITLSEVIVNAMDPVEIVKEAVRKIPHNFSHDNELLRCFYRETTQKGRRYIYVAEAVTDLYKVGYNRFAGADRVAIERGRRLVSVRRTDTLGAKIQGGPTLPIGLDLMKKQDMLLDEKELALYHLRMEVPVVENDRPQIVISFAPLTRADHVLYHGKMYIDRQTLAFSRIEMSLDMSDETRASEVILLRKPAGVRFRPRDFTVTVAYRYDGTTSRIHYMHTDVRFYCEWRRKLFASPYHVEAEMVVTDLLSSDAKPISGRSSFSSRDSFYDKVAFFDDPDFWADYNIIEPTESLEHAIKKLKK
jgi:hypothetical protein